MADNHPFIESILQRAGGDYETLSERDIAGEMHYLKPEERADLRIKLQAYLVEDDGVSLQKKAQLLNLSRQLGDTDRFLRRRGR